MSDGDPWGTDVALAEDAADVAVVDVGLSRLAGPAVVAQDVAEALRTPRGSLPWDRDAGSDLLRWLNSAATQAEVAEAEIRRVAIADPRVDAATVAVGRDEAGGGYRLVFRALASTELQTVLFDV